jgi:hypothetical protein
VWGFAGSRQRAIEFGAGAAGRPWVAHELGGSTVNAGLGPAGWVAVDAVVDAVVGAVGWRWWWVVGQAAWVDVCWVVSLAVCSRGRVWPVAMSGSNGRPVTAMA